MKKIYFIRHAKSSWEEQVEDHDRPLSDRGFDDAILISNELIKKEISAHIQMVFSSTAKRAKTTAQIVTDILKIPEEKVNYMNDLYSFNGISVSKFLKELPQELDTILVFGHNPAFTILVNSLGSQFFANIPTSGTVAISFDCDNWTDLQNGKTLFHIFPKDLK
ncbi:SixA phosphatase family protein [Aquimarina agarivorans]|uniref:SixA phosphatase family protein n=1 Tax=Aquimarina agarivorans TaxID=980584 RepID=UPI000248F2FA|nr:histidine phosphatase family protein [Aquimarina agarivorans]